MAHSPLVFVHVGAGLLALFAGAAALVYRKGSSRHRLTGRAFGIAMLVMTAMAWYLAVFYKPNATNSTMGVFTFYLVATAWMTVVRKPGESGRFEIVVMLVALAVAAVALRFGLQAAGSETGMKDRMPAEFYFVVASIAALLAISDLRLIVRGGVSGARRIARHLWRMCFALFIAAGSFFIGQPFVWSTALRKSGLLAVPVLTVIVVMLYWLWRVRFSSARRKSAPQVKWTTQGLSPTRS